MDNLVELENTVRKEALYSALKNKGQVRSSTLLGVLLKSNPELKKDMDSLRTIIDKVCSDVNSKLLNEIETEANKLGISYEEKESTRKEMINLKVNGIFRTRIPPEPSKHLHLGHGISFLLNSIYAEKYNGSVILRFEDTNPQLAKQEFVDSILDDIQNYLKIKPASITYASDSMDAFYKNAEKMIEKEKAFVCTCDREIMSENRNKGLECECRALSTSENIERWNKMLTKGYALGEAILRLKGDMKSKNMVMRDPVLFRIVDEPHYRQGNKYSVWPVYDFENSILDATEKITHVLRSNEFGTMREELQSYIREILELEQPEVIQYGRFEVDGANTKGRELREAISKGMYSGWDDPRLYTLKALKRKGITYLALIEIAKEVGLSPTPTRIDRKMISTFNRRIIDNEADRFSFVYEPIRLDLRGVVGKALIPYHPQLPDRGTRELHVNDIILIRTEDNQNGMLRLVDFANITIEQDKVLIQSKDVDSFRKAGGKKIINWLPDDQNQIMRCSVLMDDGTIKEGLVERNIAMKKIGDMVQLERFGFCRIEEIADDEIRLIFAHK